MPDPDPNDAPPLLITRREAAAMLRVCEATLRNLERRGVLVAVRIGNKVRYRPSDLDAAIQRMASERDR